MSLSPEPSLLIKTGPFTDGGMTTPRLMVDVLLALAPTVLAAVFYFGIGALLVIGAATAGAVLTERFLGKNKGSLADASAALTGVLLGLTLPPAFPLWMAFLGGIAGIGLGKLVFGGLGQNLFNPALVGRAFLQAAFPTAITTWTAPAGPAGIFQLPGTTLTLPFTHPVDVVSAATPLAQMKFSQVTTPLAPLFLGDVPGSLGETGAVLILAGGLYLAARRALDWRIPTGILLTVVVLAGVLWAIDGARFPSPWFMLGSGGLALGAVFMATDPVTSPMSPRGSWLFAAGVGILVVVIRIWGGLPEGVMYAILLMNAATPLIDRYTQPRPLGRKESA